MPPRSDSEVLDVRLYEESRAAGLVSPFVPTNMIFRLIEDYAMSS